MHVAKIYQKWFRRPQSLLLTPNKFNIYFFLNFGFCKNIAQFTSFRS